MSEELEDVVESVVGDISVSMAVSGGVEGVGLMAACLPQIPALLALVIVRNVGEGNPLRRGLWTHNGPRHRLSRIFKKYLETLCHQLTRKIAVQGDEFGDGNTAFDSCISYSVSRRCSIGGKGFRSSVDHIALKMTPGLCQEIRQK